MLANGQRWLGWFWQWSWWSGWLSSPVARSSLCRCLLLTLTSSSAGWPLGLWSLAAFDGVFAQNLFGDCTFISICGEHARKIMSASYSKNSSSEVWSWICLPGWVMFLFFAGGRLESWCCLVNAIGLRTKPCLWIVCFINMSNFRKGSPHQYVEMLNMFRVCSKTIPEHKKYQFQWIGVPCKTRPTHTKQYFTPTQLFHIHSLVIAHRCGELTTHGETIRST